MRSRLLAALAALLLVPSLAWAPTQVAPTGGGTTPVTASSSDTGYGKTWYTTNQGAPVAAIFIDDLNMLGFHPGTGTQMDIYQSSNAGRQWELARSISGFGAGSFGQLLEVFQSGSRTFFVMLASSGGLSWADSVASTAGGGGWSVGPAGGGTQDGITGAVGPNGTIVYMRESGGVGQACRSTNSGTSFVCATFRAAGSVGTALSMVSPTSGVWMFANGGQIWRSTDDGQSFTAIVTPTNGLQGIRCLTPAICIAATGGVTSASVWRSTDAGASWALSATLPGTWGTTLWGAAGIINFGGGVVTILGTNTVTVNSPGFRSTDFGLTWVPLPIYNAVPGGTNGRSITGPAIRGGRAVAFQWTAENINTQLYTPVLGAGQTEVGDKFGNTLAAGAGCAGQAPSATFYTNISTTASVQLITGTANRRIVICAVNLVVLLADNVALVEGTGATCATSPLGLFGGATAATGWNLAANGQVTFGDGKGVLRRTAVNGNNVCLLVSAATQASGLIVWTLD